MSKPPNPAKLPPATGDARAARIDSILGPGASEDPACWARAVEARWVTQPDGSLYEPAPWPRQPKESPDA